MKEKDSKIHLSTTVTKFDQKSDNRFSVKLESLYVSFYTSVDMINIKIPHIIINLSMKAL